MRVSPGRSGTVMAAVMAAVMPLAACGSGSGAGNGVAADTSDTSGAAAGRRTSTTRAVDPAWDVGQRVEITDEGFHPHELVATMGEPVVFTNLTGEAVAIRSIGEELDSGPIRPGATWEWVPDATGSTAYADAADPGRTGVVLVEPPDGQF